VALLGRGQMDTGDWIALAGVAVTLITSLISSLLPTWYKNRLERTKASQPVEQSQQEIEPNETVFKTPYFIYLVSFSAVLFSVVSLSIEIYKQDPITRTTIFLIAYFAGTILYHMIFLILISEMLQTIRIVSLMDRTVFIQNKHQEYIERITQLVEAEKDTSKKDFDEA
jgi:hypothetical protein